MDAPFSVVWGSTQVSYRRCNEDGWVLSRKCIGRSMDTQMGRRATSLPSQRRARECGAGGRELGGGREFQVRFERESRINLPR